jgi:deoxyribodipyrimidine photo-lyase
MAMSSGSSDRTQGMPSIGAHPQIEGERTSLAEMFAPNLAAAHARIAAVSPVAYALTRNALDGAVSGLSPYITHGFVTLTDVRDGIAARHPLGNQDKFVFELGWRAYFRHVWQHRGDAILQSLQEGPLPDTAYIHELPADVRQGCTGVPAVDEAVRTLYVTGMLHNHARLWLASYIVHVRKVHWRTGADWLYGHLLDGDLASNHLSWQWVAGTGSQKPYLFNADNVARHAPEAWHSPGTVIDASYETIERMAHESTCDTREALPLPSGGFATLEPALSTAPPESLGVKAPYPSSVAGRHVLLVHPWSLRERPDGLPADTLSIGVFLSEFHEAWPWSQRRWQFVGSRMAELTVERWHGDAASVEAALSTARSVRSIDDLHLRPWLARWAESVSPPELFPVVDRRCDSFSQWWSRAKHGLRSTPAEKTPR